MCDSRGVEELWSWGVAMRMSGGVGGYELWESCGKRDLRFVKVTVSGKCVAVGEWRSCGMAVVVWSN